MYRNRKRLRLCALMSYEYLYLYRGGVLSTIYEYVFQIACVSFPIYIIHAGFSVTSFKGVYDGVLSCRRYMYVRTRPVYVYCVLLLTRTTGISII